MNTESQGVFHHKSIDVEITKHNEVYPEIEVERIRPMLHVTCTSGGVDGSCTQQPAATFSVVLASSSLLPVRTAAPAAERG
ncbi:hypothetical protein BaRGS_00029474 [Batillaria attramentaria]|uniref:Uncharacterized protein n=1 Tax=Batillaria attramentaria TaxID=370345 RepID=A0ABD0JX22_9CAEN